jgi:hypothetical protein
MRRTGNTPLFTVTRATFTHPGATGSAEELLTDMRYTFRVDTS